MGSSMRKADEIVKDVVRAEYGRIKRFERLRRKPKDQERELSINYGIDSIRYPKHPEYMLKEEDIVGYFPYRGKLKKLGNACRSFNEGKISENELRRTAGNSARQSLAMNTRNAEDT